MKWFDLKVASVTKATESATTVTFSVPEEIENEFQWTPGQHITVQLNIENEVLSRNYSISSPLSRVLSITVKAVKKGKVSNYINKSLKEGQTIKVSTPNGHFTLVPDTHLRRTHYFFAAGSGITPIYSMLISVLEGEPDSFACLLYGNKDTKRTIFSEELNDLAEKYEGRLSICHAHSSPSWFSASPWRTGRIDAIAIHQFIKENPPYAQDAHYYLCGPGSFLPDVKEALNAIDVPNRRIHMESFGGAIKSPSSESIEAKLEVSLQEQNYLLDVEPGQSLLQAMLKKGIDAPYSCEGGVCGTCRCKLKAGKVTMANNLVLDESQVNDGEILACQAIAQTEAVSIKYN